MIFIAIMLFMIGQALNMGTSYWVIWAIWLFVKTIIVTLDVVKKQRNSEPSYLEKRVADKIDNILDEIVEDEAEED